jgi:hypothetical protein
MTKMQGEMALIRGRYQRVSRVLHMHAVCSVQTECATCMPPFAHAVHCNLRLNLQRCTSSISVDYILAYAIILLQCPAWTLDVMCTVPWVMHISTFI